MNLPSFYSMTGYGQAQVVCPQIRIQAQIHSLNSRQLEIHISGPREWMILEPSLRNDFKKKLQRGRIQVHLSYQLNEAPSDQTMGLTLGWQPDWVAARLGLLEQFCQAQGIPFQPDVQLVWALSQSSVPEMGTPSMPLIEDPVVHQAVIQANNQALEDLLRMRSQEAQHLVNDLQGHLNTLLGHLGQMRELEDQVLPLYRDKLIKRIAHAGIPIDIQDERLIKELAFFADRADISEELTRLQAHLTTFGEILCQPTQGPIGRKLDFLCQEIARELTTLANKANLLPLQQAALEGKTELEKLREQVQNLE